MASFPSVPPKYSASKDFSSPINKVLLGDGYERSLNFGLNSFVQEWQLEWLVDQSVSAAIDGFLQSCSDSGDFFQWQPPDSNSELNWRCDEWTVEQLQPFTYRISASFRRVFELSAPLLTSALTICQEEYCGFDYGNWEIIVTGSPYINSTVSAPPELPCTGVSYQWYRNGVAIAGATLSTYTLVGADNGQAITLGYDCPGESPGGTGISAAIYPIPYPWENYDGSDIIFSTPGVFSVKFDVYANFGVYQCNQSSAMFGESFPLYRTQPGFSSANVTGFKMSGPAVRNQTGICYPVGGSGSYAAGTPYARVNGNWINLINGSYGWTQDAGVAWGPTGYSLEPRGIAQHLPVEMTFNGQPVYAPLPA